MSSHHLPTIMKHHVHANCGGAIILGPFQRLLRRHFDVTRFTCIAHKLWCRAMYTGTDERYGVEVTWFCMQLTVIPGPGRHDIFCTQTTISRLLALSRRAWRDGKLYNNLNGAQHGRPLPVTIAGPPWQWDASRQPNHVIASPRIHLPAGKRWLPSPKIREAHETGCNSSHLVGQRSRASS